MAASVHRRGTALIIALVLLVALLLLGLPFIFTQSASLTGTKSYADARTAQIGRDNAANIATAAAAYAMIPALGMPMAAAPIQTTAQWSSLDRYFLSPRVRAQPIAPPTVIANAIQLLPSADGTAADADSSVIVQPANSAQLGVGITPSAPTPGQPAQSTLLNARITDEAGKLDPNNMSPQLWSMLLAALKIQDWSYLNLVPSNTYADPDTKYGMLAQALAHLRGSMPGHRITDLDQLMQANPQIAPLYNNGTVTQVRWPLTRSELERLRPFLTLHNPRPGRMGLIDLGSVIAIDATYDNTVIDCPTDALALPLGLAGTSSFPDWSRMVGQNRLLGDGTMLLAEGVIGNSVSANGTWAIVDDFNFQGERANYTTHMLMGEPLFTTGGTFINTQGGANTTSPAGSAVMIEAPAPLNAHVIGVIMRSTLPILPTATNPIGRPYDDSPTASRDDGILAMVGSTLTKDANSNWISGNSNGLFGMASNKMFLVAQAQQEQGWPLYLDTAPIAYGDERPPLGILSSGVFSIDADATVTDVLGRPTAQASRRDIVQALPQELLLERRWRTQGAFHQLVYSRFASQMQAWPVPYERLSTDATNGPYLPPGATAPPGLGGVVAPDDVDPVPTAAGVSGTFADTEPTNGTPTPGIPAPGTGLRARPLVDLATAQLNIPAPNPSTSWNQVLTHCQIDWRVPFGANPFNGLSNGDAALQAETLPLQYATPNPPGPTTFSLSSVAVPGLVATAPSVGAGTPPVSAVQPQCYDILPNGATQTPLDSNLLVELRPDGFHIEPNDSNYQPLGYSLAPLPFSTAVSSPGWPQTNSQATGFVIERPSSGLESNVLNVIGTHEMDARHLSLWIKPTSDWIKGIIPIFELRAPTDNISQQSFDVISGDWTTGTKAGSNGSQNYLGLAYDANTGLLVMSLAPPSIEHTVPSAMLVPRQDPSDQVEDTSTLGQSSMPAGDANPSLADTMYADGGAGLQAVTPLFEPNRVLHAYQIPLSTSNVFFRANVWHHLELAIASDRPEASAIIVDGVIGQDITKTTLAMAAMGDHCTLPALPLAATIPLQVVTKGDPTVAGDPATATGPTMYPNTGIVLAPLTIAGKQITAASILPARGMVRIDDEYFLYDSIAGSTLQGYGNGANSYGPLRGRRQDTNTSAAAAGNPDVRFPSTQQHIIGALVTAAGYRVPAYNMQAQVVGGKPVLAMGQLYPGGSKLLGQVLPGDPTQGNRIWSSIDQTQSAAVTNLDGVNYLWAYTNNGTLPLSTAGIPGNFTSSFTAPGVVMVQDPQGNRSYYYFHSVSSSGAGVALQGVQPINGAGWNQATDGTIFSSAPAGVKFQPKNGGPAMVYMASLYVDSTPWTTYDSRGASFTDGDDIVSVMMPQTGVDPGHIEWFEYNGIVNDPVDGSGGFFVSATGFTSLNSTSGRGVDRTKMTLQPFPVSSKIIPVQTEVGQSGHWIATGDVVTLLGHDIYGLRNPIAAAYGTGSPASSSPGLQMTVRYGGTDGYPPQASGSWNDSKNEYFCFSDWLPPVFTGPIPLTNLEIICGNCWSGDDLTPNVLANALRAAQPRGYLPRLDLWTDSTAIAALPATAGPGDVALNIATVFFGTLDPRPNRAAAEPPPAPSSALTNPYGSYLNPSSGPNVDNVDCEIDGICAGPLAPAVNSTNVTQLQDDGHDLVPNPTNGTPLSQNSLLTSLQPTSIDYFVEGGAMAFTLDQASNLTGVLVHATAPIFPYGTCGNMGLVLIDGEVFAYQVPTPSDLTTILNLQFVQNGQPSVILGQLNQSINWSQAQETSCCARLVARGLLGTIALTHTIGAGPVLTDNAQQGILPPHPQHNARLSAARLPLGPVLQLQTSIAFDATTQAANWFMLSDQDTSVPGQPCKMNAPAALFCTADGKNMEMIGLVGPISHPTVGSPYANQGLYTSATWLRGLYNTAIYPAPGWALPSSGYPPIVIGWWPRFASAYPQGPLTAQQLRSRYYAWFGLPVPAYGAYFDTTRRDSFFPGTNLAEIQYDDLECNNQPFFQIQARALSNQDRWTGASTVLNQGSMDWSLQISPTLPASTGSTPQDLSDVFKDANDVARCFNTTVNGNPQAQPVDGAEVRISWCYNASPPSQSAGSMPTAFASLGQACGSTPIFANADVRYMAPVRVLATERSR